VSRREILVHVLLWYNVLSIGVWAGGTIFQMLVVVPIWNASPPESVRAFFGGTPYMTTIYHFFGPLTQIARALPLFALVWVAWPYAALRPWVAAAGATMLFGLVFTRTYVYPINDVLFARAGAGLDDAAVRALATRWIIADRLRLAVMGAGYVCLLRAFRLPVG
jgi:hypothetical protein